MKSRTTITREEQKEQIHKLWRKLVYGGGLTPREWRKFNFLKLQYEKNNK